MLILCFAGVCCLVLGKWLIFPVYGGADCPWRLMVGVNDLLYVVLECFCITVNQKGNLVGLFYLLIFLFFVLL
jgi:hypothetical protein